MRSLPVRLGRGPAALAVFAISLAILARLVPDTTYGDGILYLQLVRDGWLYAHHHLYLPILVPFIELLGWAGVPPRTAAFLFSAFMVSAGNAVLWLIVSRRVPAARFALAIVFVAATAPVVLFFGTTVELHGQHYAWVALALWALDVAVERRTRPSWLLAGLALACVPSSHLTGFLLVPAMALWMWTGGGRRPFTGGWRPRRIGRAALYLAPLALYVVLFHLTTFFRTGVLRLTPDLLADPIGFEVESKITARGLHPGEWLPYLRDAWLSPAFGVWLVFFLGVWRFVPSRRRVFWLALLGVIPYVVMLPLHGVPERGAYFIGLVPWVVFIVSRLARDHVLLRMLVFWCVLAGAAQMVAGVSQVRSYPAGEPPDSPARADSWARDAMRVDADIEPAKRIFLCEDLWRKTHLVYDHGAGAVHVPLQLVPPQKGEPPPGLVTNLAAFVDNGAVYVTERLWERLPALWPELRGHLEAVYELRRVRAGTFEGRRLERK